MNYPTNDDISSGKLKAEIASSMQDVENEKQVAGTPDLKSGMNRMPQGDVDPAWRAQTDALRSMTDSIERGNCVLEGLHIGLIQSVSKNFVSQKVNRDGGLVLHDVNKLSTPVCEGEFVEITYANGLGMVKVKSVDLGVAR